MIVAERMLLADGGGPLEDAILVNDHIALLLDGGTGIGNRLFTSDLSDARLFVRSLVQEVDRLAPAAPDLTPKELMRRAHERVCAALRGLRPDLSPADAGRMPIATAVLVKWRNNQFEGVLYGDVGCVHEVDGRRASFHDPRVIAKDGPILARWVELQRAGASAAERRTELVPMVAADRLQNYLEPRYSTITLNPASIETGIEFAIADAGRGKAVVASDGFLREADVFGCQTREAILAEALAGGVFRIAERVRALETADPERTGAPRLKDHDDMAAAAIRYVA